jgi:hypothetical protein
MAMRFSSLKSSILVILYDYMLTSDHEGFWFGIPAISEALPPETSGAFVQKALDALIFEKLVDQGGTEMLRKDLFALTEFGIKAAEELIEEKGTSIEDYEPSPDSDLLLSRIHEPEKHKAISDTLAELKGEIEKSNSFDEDLSGGGDLISGEVAAASVLMTAERVRMTRLKALILPALRSLAKTFADKSIGEMARQLIILLLGLDS